MVYRDVQLDGTTRLTGGAVVGGGGGEPGPEGPEGPEGPAGPAGPAGIAGVFVVHHGTDPNVARPNYPIVYWIGSADPVNAFSYDFYKEE